ncbi:MAG: hypothetical protein ACTTH5_00725 [Wolinella sp.]
MRFLCNLFLQGESYLNALIFWLCLIEVRAYFGKMSAKEHTPHKEG